MRRANVLQTVAIGSVLSSAGCYNHVVKESGIGVGAREIYEPNVKLPEDDGKDPWGTTKQSSNPGVRNWKSVSSNQPKRPSEPSPDPW